MKISKFIKDLQALARQDAEIEIECPNGLMVDPRIKIRHENPSDPFSPFASHVITWRD